MGERILFCLALAMLLASTASGGAKRGLPEQIVPECFGVNIHFMGDNEKEVTQIADAGFKFVRMDFSWVHIEHEKGLYDFSAYDGLMTALDRHGIRPLFILDYGNPLYDGDMAPYTDEGRKAFAAFAKAAASRYKDRGILWEIWNEPNGAGFWRPKPDTGHYALLANATAKAVREADPTATILGPALAGTDPSYLEQIFKGGVLENLDVVSVHPYRGTHPETAASDYKVIRALIGRYAPKGKHIPIVSGEWGYTAANMPVEQQSKFLVRQFLSNMMCGVKLSIWYDWHNDGQDPKEGEHNFGTVYWDYSPKPAYNAVQTLTKELKGCRLVKRLYTSSHDDYVLLFKSDAGYKLAAWTTGEPHEIELPLDTTTVTITDIYGKSSREKVMAGMLSVKLDQAVTYIGVPSKSDRLVIEEAWEAEPDALKAPNAANLSVTSRLTNVLDAPIKIKGIGLSDPSGKALTDVGGSAQLAPGKKSSYRTALETPWDGSSHLSTVVVMSIEGMEEPFRRMVEFDTSRRFTVTAAPPAQDFVLLTFSNPSGEPFTGNVMLSSGPGMTVGEIMMPVKIAKGQNLLQVRYPVILADRKQYTFRFSVFDGRNDTVYTSSDRTYKIAETFNGADRVNVKMDGDAKVEGTLEPTASKLPEKLDGCLSCTKLDYRFGSGWKFGRLVPKEETKISGQPKEIGAWIYGDKSNNFVRVRITDSTGQTFQPHLATLDFEGWRFVTCRIEPANMGWWGGANDGVIHWPIKWDTLLLLDSNGGKEQSGTVYAGPMWVVY